MIRSNYPGAPSRGRVPRWSPPPPPPLSGGPHNEPSFDSTVDRDDFSSLDDASACGRSIPIPKYWTKHDRGHSSHGSQPSDGFNSPVYQSPFPEEQRLYYEPQPQILPQAHHPQQQAYHQLNQVNNLPCNGQQQVNNTLGRNIVRQSPNSQGAPSPTSSPAGLHACGGHCIAFESFCHYCLRVCFVAGILTGISLCIAGGVLRTPSGSHNHSNVHRGAPKRGGDLVVLIYIGVLSAMVCSVLLAVQCCVAGQLENRKRGLGMNSGTNRHLRVIGGNGGLLPSSQNQPLQIPMSTLHRSNPSSSVTHHDEVDRASHVPISNEAETINRQPQLQPLLARLVQRENHEWDNRHGKDRRLKEISDWDHNTLPRGSGVVATTNSHGVTTCHRSCDHYRSAQDHNGVPWWSKDDHSDSRH